MLGGVVARSAVAPIIPAEVIDVAHRGSARVDAHLHTKRAPTFFALLATHRQRVIRQGRALTVRARDPSPAHAVRVDRFEGPGRVGRFTSYCLVGRE